MSITTNLLFIVIISTMNKVFFTCYWTDADTNLNALKMNTPQCSGVWKNITGTTNITEADYIVILDDLDRNLLKRGRKYFDSVVKDNYENVLFFARENDCVVARRKPSWFTTDVLPNMKNIYSDKTGFVYTFTPANFLGKTYDDLKSLKYPKKTKPVSAIVSSTGTDPTYMQRKRFLIEYSKTNKVDIYGKGWEKNNPFGDNYKGVLGTYYALSILPNQTTKFDGLIDYDFSISLENYPQDKIISEKFSDAILSWTIPIYWGNKCVDIYPKHSYYSIDLDDPDVDAKVNEILARGITDKNINAMEEARNLFLDKYNIWEYIYQLINNEAEAKRIYSGL
jgi:hypothetical protein